MQELQRFQNVLESRKIAKIMEKDHSNLLKDIGKYQSYFAEVNFNSGDYFKEDSYLDKNNQSRKCYLITKKGCEFLAHKMTGQKGAIFTAKYIELFHQMEQRESNELRELLQSQRMLNEAVIKVLQKVAINEEEEVPVLELKKTEVNLDALIQEQKENVRTKLEGFPPEVRRVADTLLQQEQRNFSYISRVLTSMGYPISHTAVRNYFVQVLKGGCENE